MGVDVVCLDSSHGHAIAVLNSLKKLKKAFPKLQVIAGNVATGDGAKALVDAGADAVKVGVGPGFYLYHPRSDRRRFPAAVCHV